jgi:hypothetical protein
MWGGLLWGLAKAKHVGEAKLADSVAIRDLTLGLTQLTARVKLYKNILLIKLNLPSLMLLALN